MIRAIETRYKGYHFRSRLEARWAVFFDHLGWGWKYEHEGYIIGMPGETLAWLPDFEVTTRTGQQFYVEVKGDPDFFKDGAWLGRLDWGGGPPGFSWCGYADEFSGEDKPVLLLGDVPQGDASGTVMHATVVVDCKGVCTYRALVTEDGLSTSREVRCGSDVDDFRATTYSRPSALPDQVGHALVAARSARFEHGQMGAT